MVKANTNVNIEDLQEKVIDAIIFIEEKLGDDLIITSGYRSTDHPVERNKKTPGEHTKGLAIDVACTTPQQFYYLVEAAIEFGCKRIGISRKNNFVHLGFDNSRPTSIWTY